MRSSSSASLNCRPSGRRGSSGGELGRVSRKPRPQLRARAAIAQLPRRTRAGTLRFAPSARSVVIGLALAALGALGYLGARETSVFAVRIVVGWTRPGDTVLTLGAGDVDRAPALLLEALA